MIIKNEIGKHAWSFENAPYGTVFMIKDDSNEILYIVKIKSMIGEVGFCLKYSKIVNSNSNIHRLLLNEGIAVNAELVVKSYM